MCQPKEEKNNYKSSFLRLFDIKQSEVRLGSIIALVLLIFFLSIKMHSNFLFFESDLGNLFLCIIAALISLIGIAIAGVAIVITLFSSEQIKILDTLEKGAFETLLSDFKWFAQVATVQVAIYICLVFIIQLPYLLVDKVPYYVITFLLSYGFFYLLFYGCSLIGNCIRLSRLRCSLDEIKLLSKNVPTCAIELKLDFLISKIFNEDIKLSKEFYKELYSLIQDSSLENRDQLLKYIAERHFN